MRFLGPRLLHRMWEFEPKVTFAMILEVHTPSGTVVGLNEAVTRPICVVWV